MKNDNPNVLAWIGVASILGLAGTNAAVMYDANVTPDVIFGSGNANGGFTVDQNSQTGVELGLRGKLRHDATGQPQNTFNSNGDGTYSFSAGVAPTQAFPTAEWSVEWSINSNWNGSSGLALDDLTYLLQIDSDPSLATSFTGFDPINDVNPNFGEVLWDHALGNNATPNGGGTTSGNSAFYQGAIAQENVAQNSWKAHWMIPGFDPTIDGTYDFALTAYQGVAGATSVPVASTRIQIIVGDGGSSVPDGGSMALLLGTSLLGLGGLRRLVKP